MIVVNIVLSLLSLWLIIFINNTYFQPALKNRERFKLYRLRDKLSVLAMTGELDENSEEYMTLLSLINSSIFATGTFKVTDFLKYVFHIHKDKEVREKIERITNNIKNTNNPEYCKIASQYFSVMHRIIRRDTVVLRVVFFPLLILISAIISLLRISTKPRSVVANKKAVIDQIDNEFCSYSHKFGGKCTA